MCLRSRPKNFQNQGCAINHLARQARFQIPLLYGAEAAIHDDQRIMVIFCQLCNPLKIAGAKKCRGFGRGEPDGFCQHNLKRNGLCQTTGFSQHIISCAGQGLAAYIRMQDKRALRLGGDIDCHAGPV